MRCAGPLFSSACQLRLREYGGLWCESAALNIEIHGGSCGLSCERCSHDWECCWLYCVVAVLVLEVATDVLPAVLCERAVDFLSGVHHSFVPHPC